MYRYSAYGLSVHSDISLPELSPLSPGRSRKNVLIRLGPVSGRPARPAKKGSWFRASPEEICLVWEDVGVFLIRHGREIAVDPAPGADEGLLRQALLGPALGMLLQQRGLFPLHAGAVALRGKAAALAGESGSGKSTLAAFLHSRGHGFISDDIAAVSFEGDVPRVLPGIPRFRLWPDAASPLGRFADDLPRLHPSTAKRFVKIEKGFVPSPLPLKAVYILADDTREEIEPLDPREGLFAVMRLCYNVGLVQAAVGAPALMEQCARLAGGASLYRFRRRRSLSFLPELAAALENHLDREA